MAQVLVRNVGQDVLKRLKRRAKANGRSLQAELQEILERAASTSMVDARRRAEKISAKLAGRVHSDSAAILAEDRAR